MKVNNQALYNQIINSLSVKNEELFSIHEKLTTLKKVNRPSDDLPAYIKATNYKIKLNDIDQYRKNVNLADGMLQFVERQLDDLSETWDRVNELTLLGLSATEDNVSRGAVSSELKNIAEFMLGIANSKYEGNYVFSGYKTIQKPFPNIDSNYSGDVNSIVVGIDNASFLTINITGDKVFSFKNFPSTSLTTQDSKHIYYNAQVGGSLKIEIRDTDDVTVIKTLEIKNVIEGVNKLSEAFKDNNLLEARAIFEIVNFAKNQVINSQTDVGAKLTRLEKQHDKLEQSDFIYKKLLSDVQDADISVITSEIANIQASLEALRLSASKIFSQSLLDFLR